MCDKRYLFSFASSKRRSLGGMLEERLCWASARIENSFCSRLESRCPEALTNLRSNRMVRFCKETYKRSDCSRKVAMYNEQQCLIQMHCHT